MKTSLRNSLTWMVVNLARLVLSLTFLFSGTVKLIDPHGTAYKIEDYAAVFHLQGWLPEGISLLFAIILAVVEFVIGVYLFFGIRHRLTAGYTIAFLLVMTPLTLYLAIEDPVPDCGCFGDALVLTNWQTFAKNVILLLSALTVSYGHRHMTRLVSQQNQWTVALYSLVYAFLFAIFNLYCLPLIDFRPYRIGTDIREAWMEGTGGDAEYETLFIMEKNGEKREFTLEDYPDSTWTFVDSRTIQTAGAEHTGIGELSIQNIHTGEEVTEEILSHDGYTFMLISPYLEKADDGIMDRLISLHDYCLEHGYHMLCLTSSDQEAIHRWQEMTGAEYPFFQVDDVVLKTMVRANPGLVLLHDGIVAKKWSTGMIPGSRELTAPLDELPWSHPDPKGLTDRILRILLWYVLPLCLFLFADRLWTFAKWIRKRSKKAAPLPTSSKGE